MHLTAFSRYVLWRKVSFPATSHLWYGYVYVLLTSWFKWRDSKEFDLSKYNSNTSKGCVLKIDHEYCKELSELHNNHPLSPDKIEDKREMLPNYQTKIADFCNIPNGNVKKLVPNFFDKKKSALHDQNLQFYLKLELTLKKLHRVLEFNQSQ